jgi:TM2 domain-containing membrane protein YozV
MKSKLTKIFPGMLYALGPDLPESASFSGGAPFSRTRGFVETFGNIIQLLIPITAALALLFFFWGLAQFIRNSGGEDAHEEGRRKMIWGVIALFVIVSVWGLTEWIGNELGIDQDPTQTVPTFRNL